MASTETQRATRQIRGDLNRTGQDLERVFTEAFRRARPNLERLLLSLEKDANASAQAALGRIRGELSKLESAGMRSSDPNIRRVATTARRVRTRTDAAMDRFTEDARSRARRALSHSRSAPVRRHRSR
jgi:predicted phage gp36 major capsid-like protein